jgi:GNAT superfamily N-acetyltransferase
MAGLEGETLRSEVLIRQAESVADIQLVRRLFKEYEAAIGVNLCFQSFEQELANLPGDYAPPSGRLLLAYIDQQPVGCIALRRKTDSICEMKRLFLRPSARGKQVGRKLVETLINEARNIGYNRMRLDTMPVKMDKAIAIYRSVGFKEIPAYYDTPVGSTLFMELKLSPRR